MVRQMPGLKYSGFSAILILILATAAVAIIAFAAFIIFKKPDAPLPATQNSPVQQLKNSPSAVSTSTPTPSPGASVPSPSTVVPSPSATPASGLSVYKNNKYGFEVSYSTPFKALSSKDNLSGYPNGAVLLYSGGQSYDVIIEVWDTKAEYESEYGPRVSELKVVESNGKFITLLNNNNTPEGQKIIDSFKLP